MKTAQLGPEVEVMGTVADARRKTSQLIVPLLLQLLRQDTRAASLIVETKGDVELLRLVQEAVLVALRRR